MRKAGAKSTFKNWWILVLELLIYGVAVAIYFLLVLHYLGNWLEHLYRNNRHVYAVMALALIVGQGVFLEQLTRALMRFAHPRLEK
jgi:hypothetical protein